MDREFCDSGFLVHYRPRAGALLPWWKAGTVCLWPSGRNWLGDGLTDILLCSSFLDIVSSAIKSTTCCLEFAEALAGTSGLRCAPSPSQECLGDSSAPSPSPGPQASGQAGSSVPSLHSCPSSGVARPAVRLAVIFVSHILMLSHQRAWGSGLWAPC